MRAKTNILLLCIYTMFLIGSFCYTDVFYVFSSSPKEKNYYAPTGYMGDASDINMSASNEVLTLNGYPSLKLRYSPRGIQKWIGIYFQNPAGNWGSYKGGYDLRGAKKLVFYARGDTGGEIISYVGIGGIKGKYPDSDVLQVGPVKLTKDWKKYTIDLKDKNLSYISGGFFFVIETKDNPLGCTIYFGDIFYEGERINATQLLSDTTPPIVKLRVSTTKLKLPSTQTTEDELPAIKLDIICDDNKDVSTWKVKISNEQNNVVKTFSGVGKTQQTLTWDGKDDIYSKLVPAGNYTISLSAEDAVGNTASTEEKIVIEVAKPEPEVKEIPKEIKIIEEEKAIRVRLQSQILFETGKWELLPQSKNVLSNVIELLKSYPENKIVVEGHTDSVGSEESNMKLSFNRAESVKRYLVENGISEDRIEVKAYGESKPIAS
ncbi:MAG: OmpA family protein, partial [Endomicrobia bacterium]|nr:OmpA family protein [Endomicrobiia bacterium]